MANLMMAGHAQSKKLHVLFSGRLHPALPSVNPIANTVGRNVLQLLTGWRHAGTLIPIALGSGTMSVQDFLVPVQC